MAQIRRATIAADVSSEINEWLETAHGYLSESDFLFKKVERDAEKLSAVDSFNSAVLRALLWHASGNIEEALRWTRNANSWPQHRKEVIQIEVLIHSNLGYFSKAAVAFPQGDWSASGELFHSLSLMTCSFEYLGKVVSGTVANDQELLASKKIGEESLVALKRIGVSEQQVRDVLDIAGEVLRSRKCFFAGDRPLIRTIHDGFLYQLRVRADAATADTMTDEVIVRMVEKNMDVPGLAFSFIPA